MSKRASYSGRWKYCYEFRALVGMSFLGKLNMFVCGITVNG